VADLHRVGFKARPRPRRGPRAAHRAPRPKRGVRATLAAEGLTIVVLALATLYALCPVHRFPPPRPFAGAYWYDPYATGDGHWLTANLHAHTRVWGGLTNGRGDADALVRRYAALGYDVAGVSDYQRMTLALGAHASRLAAYEQGFNVRKAHLIALGARSVDWMDYPLLQSPDELQHRIDRLRADGATVVLAHPRLRCAFSDGDLRELTGYAALEVASSTTDGEAAWDVALTAGRVVWGVGGDDTHDVANLSRTARVWTLIDAPTAAPADLLAAIRAGRTIAVRGTAGRADVALRSLTMRGDTLRLALDGAPASISIVGAGGVVLGRAADTHALHVLLPHDAPYARAVVRTASTVLYLAPVLRAPTNALPSGPSATVDFAATLFRRAMLLTLACCAGLRRRTAAPSHVARRAA
jgi:hypothetical protein